MSVDNPVILFAYWKSLRGMNMDILICIIRNIYNEMKCEFICGRGVDITTKIYKTIWYFREYIYAANSYALN